MIERKMIAVPRCHHFRRHAGTLSIPFDKPRLSVRLCDPAYGVIRAGILWILRHSYPQFGAFRRQCLGAVLTNDPAFAVLGTDSVSTRDFGSDFISWQMVRRLFVASFLLFFDLAAESKFFGRSFPLQPRHLQSRPSTDHHRRNSVSADLDHRRCARTSFRCMSLAICNCSSGMFLD